MEKIKQRWREYVNEFMQEEEKCPEVQEIIFVERSANVGAGLLFREKPPGWEKIVELEGEAIANGDVRERWLLRDKNEQPYGGKVCYFSPTDREFPPGW